jgi:hypothetical protein
MSEKVQYETTSLPPVKTASDSAAHEYRLSNGKHEITVVILRHFSDNGRQGDAGGRADRLVR